MRGRRVFPVAAGALIAALVAAPGPALAEAVPANEWQTLTTQMAAPWASLQRSDGSFSDYLSVVDSAALLELLSRGLPSSVPGSALANRKRTRALVSDLVTHRLSRIAAPYTTGDPAGRLTLLSDPPWNPPAYDAFSLALL